MTKRSVTAKGELRKLQREFAELRAKNQARAKERTATTLAKARRTLQRNRLEERA